jgi:UDP-N-acetylmuramoyl-tripeptide--D-alanyl-D-alanine ligase
MPADREIDAHIEGVLKIEDIITATGGQVICSNAHTFSGVSIDSRSIRKGELFIALKGERFDGHDFLQEALRTGCGAIVKFSPSEMMQGKTIISVEDTLIALQRLARFMRLKRTIPLVGVTGSNGKTTTKELVASILGSTYRVLKNTGNLNNHIGLPLTLARIDEKDEVAVLEMGASAPGNIQELCEIALPDYGVLTNVSPSHLEGFKDMETLRRTKLEILNYIRVAIVNADDSFLMEGIQASGFKGKIVRYGINNDAEIYATDIALHEKGGAYLLHIGKKTYFEVHPKLSGRFNIYNVLAAASVGHIFHIELEKIKNVIDSFDSIPMRFEVKDLEGIQIISDVYNANPASMEEALKELVRLRKKRSIAVLGDMLELGSYAHEAHRELVRWMSGLPVDIFIAIGSLMSSAASEFSGKVYTFRNSLEARELIRSICREGDTLLIKGSRGMHMERILETSDVI